MNRRLSRIVASLGLPPMPIVARLGRHGQKIVDVSREVWRVDQKILDWRDLATIHPILLYVFKLHVLDLFETRTEDTIHKNFRRLVQIASKLEFENWEAVGSEDMAIALERSIEDALRRLSYQTAKQIRTTATNLYDFLEKFDLPFYSNEFHARLNELYFKTDIPHKGVMTLDPEQGPLSRIDEHILLASLELDDGDLRDVSILTVMHAWGLRPRQVSLLNRDDLMVSATGDYTLRVPRVKQHEGAIGAEYKLRKLTPQVGALLERYISSTTAADREPWPPSTPMFFYRDSSELSVDRLSTKAIALTPTKYVELHKVISPVTGTLMNLSPKRLRETFGTRCAEKPNVTKELLAEMLDHSSTRSLEVYFDFRESIAQEMGALIARRSGRGTIRDLTESFMGERASLSTPVRTEFPLRFIKNVSEASNNKAEAMRLMPPELLESAIEIPSLGYCGGDFRCGLAPLLACYSCSDFEPWIHANHGVIVTWIDKLYERAIKQGRRDDAEEFELLKAKAEYVARRARELANDASGEE